MAFKLKELPEKVYWLETKQFDIIDEETGKEYSIRIGESSKSVEQFMWHEPGGWDDISDNSILEYLEEEFSNDEFDFENEERKKQEKVMDEAYEEFIKENGEVNDLKKFDSLVSKFANIINDRSMDYYKRFYTSYSYALKKTK